MQPVRSAKRRIFPRRLTIRWFATRGWAFGAGLMFAICAGLFHPETFDGAARFIMPLLFGLAAAALITLGIYPERLAIRGIAIVFAVAVALAHCWTLLDGSGAADTQTRIAAGGVWLFIAYACWLLATLTAKIPSRR